MTQQQQQPPTAPTGKSASKTVLSTVLGAGLFLGFWGGIGWVLLRPWIAPEGTPLERCLKGQIPHEFREEDQRGLRALQVTHTAASNAMDARFSAEWEQRRLMLVRGEATSDRHGAALLASHSEEMKSFMSVVAQEWPTACREAASRAGLATPPTSVPAQP